MTFKKTHCGCCVENNLLAGKAGNRQTSEWAFTAVRVRDEERQEGWQKWR